MILYGDLIATFTIKNNIPVPYRVQEEKECIANDIVIDSKNKILHNFLLKKNLGKTYYSSLPMNHNSLGLKSYLHATSPIRRYSDLLVHYQINRFINNQKLISKNEIEKNISIINNLTRQNINKYREDQKFWINKWFELKSFISYRVIFLKWINKYKNISIIYFVDYSFSSICYLNTKIDIKVGDKISIRDISNNYNDMLYFQLIC